MKYVLIALVTMLAALYSHADDSNVFIVPEYGTTYYDLGDGWVYGGGVNYFNVGGDTYGTDGSQCNNFYGAVTCTPPVQMIPGGKKYDDLFKGLGD